MAIRYSNPKWQEFKDDGTPAVGWKVNFYEVGTSTRKDTYSDQAQSSANTNPVILDSRGEADIWLNGSYKVVLTDESDVVKWTVDSWPGSETVVGSNSSNLVSNPSFETDTSGDGNPDNWTITPFTGGTVVKDTSDSSHGSSSLKFTSTGTGGGTAEMSPYMEVSDISDYIVSFEIKSSVADVFNKVEIDWYDGGRVQLSSTVTFSDSATNPTSWTRKSSSVTPMSGAKYARIKITGCDSSDSTVGTVRFDNIQFYFDDTVAGVTTFTGLTDTPSSYAGAEGQFAKVVGGAMTFADVTVNPGLGAYSNLKIIRPSVSTVTATVDDITVSDGTSRKALTSVSVTPDITASGANGLDTGSEANSTWYSIWVINNGTTTAGLLSTSATAPTMPSGYTFKKRVGWCYNDSSGNLWKFWQYDNQAFLADQTYDIYISGGTMTSWTVLSPNVPPTAGAVYMLAGMTNVANFYFSLDGVLTTGGIILTGYGYAQVWQPLNSSRQFYYRRDGGSGALWTYGLGWLDNI